MYDNIQDRNIRGWCCILCFCNVGELGSIPGLGRCPGEGKVYPLQYSGLENSMDYSWGRKELDKTERLSLHIVPFRNCQSSGKKQTNNLIIIIWRWMGEDRSLTAGLGSVWQGTGKFSCWRCHHTESGRINNYPRKSCVSDRARLRPGVGCPWFNMTRG